MAPCLVAEIEARTRPQFMRGRHFLAKHGRELARRPVADDPIEHDEHRLV